ncbi:MAG: hypothetical protein ACJAZ9_000940 [Neolewinella sp.]|jgi:hypothetical protein
MIRFDYKKYDVGFALLCTNELTLFYVISNSVFISYASGIHLVESERGQLKLHAIDGRNARLIAHSLHLRPRPIV